MNVGFIGTGSMGSILIESLIRSGGLRAADIIASNRTRSKVERLAREFEGLRVASSNLEVAESSEIIFICVKPTEFRRVIEEIATAVRSDQIVVSITSPVMVELLEKRLSGKVAKIIPSITNYMLSGPTLCIYGKRMMPAEIEKVDMLMAHISRPIRVEEQFTRVSSDISSCGPAFFALLLQQFIRAAVEETGLPEDEATQLASEMLLGTGLLLTSGRLTPESLQRRVAVPGGITAEGLRLMENELEGMFHQLIRITHAKFREDVEKVNSMFED